MFARSFAMIGVFLGFVYSTSAQAEDRTEASDISPISVSVGAGTTGVNLGTSLALTREIAIRAEIEQLSYKQGFSSSSADYSGNLTFTTASVTAEFHPTSAGLFAAGGILTGQRRVKVVGKPTGSTNQSFVLNGVTYTVSQLVKVNGNVDLGSLAPYVGIGWDNSMSRKDHWGLRAALGVAISGSPKVRLTATGPLANDPTVKSNLAAEQDSLSKDVKNLRYYPVASVGLSYQF